jgi:hypothetical protein
MSSTKTPNSTDTYTRFPYNNDDEAPTPPPVPEPQEPEKPSRSRIAFWSGSVTNGRGSAAQEKWNQWRQHKLFWAYVALGVAVIIIAIVGGALGGVLAAERRNQNPSGEARFVYS